MTDALTAVIPAYNEEASLESVLCDLQAACGDLLTEIIVVDDGSSDRTAAIARAAGVTLIRHPRNLGYGAALKSGFRNAKTSFVLTFDADGQHDSRAVRSLWEARADADMVVGARQGLIHSLWWRMPGKWLIGFIANYLAKQRIPDLNSGLRLIRHDVGLRYLHLCPSGFSLSTTLTLALMSRGWRVAYVPVHVRERQGTSEVSLVTGLETIVLVLRLISLFNPLRVFVPASFAIGLIGIVWEIPIALAGRGISVGSMLASVTAILLFGLGLLCDQISQLRLERFE